MQEPLRGNRGVLEEGEVRIGLLLVHGVLDRHPEEALRGEGRGARLPVLRQPRQDHPTDQAEVEEMVKVSLELTSSLYGALYASVFAAAGYLKSRRREEFSPTKFLESVLLGALIGAMAGGMGLDIRDLGIEDLLLVGGATTLTRDLLRAALRSSGGGR